MSAEEHTTSGNSRYAYKAVESALAAVFRIDTPGREGWLRGRLQHFRRLGFTPRGAGKDGGRRRRGGAAIAYSLEEVDKWLVGLELAHLRFDPTLIVELIDQNWGRPRGDLTAQEAFDSGKAKLRDLVTVARAGERPDVMVFVWFDAMSQPPVIGYTTERGTDSFASWLTMPGLDGYGRWQGEDRDVPRRAAIFNLSDRIRRLDRALASPPPRLPGGVAGQILEAGRRARRWKR